MTQTFWNSVAKLLRFICLNILRMPYSKALDDALYKIQWGEDPP